MPDSVLDELKRARQQDPIIEHDAPRFITRQDLGGPASQLPFASLPFASDGLFGGETPFAGSSAELGWNTDDVDGVPTGLPNLVRVLFGADAAPPSDLPPPTPDPSVPVQTPESVQLADVERSDVFALPDLEEELDEDEDDDDDDWDEQEDKAESELPAPNTAPLASEVPQDWQVQMDAMANQRWLFAGAALIVGAAAGALLT